jgi:hypothetical protein
MEGDVVVRVAEPTVVRPAPTPEPPLDSPHGHVSACYWDVAECRWRCAADRCTTREREEPRRPR